MDENTRKKVELLIEEIRQTFSNVTLGDGLSLHQADAIDDYANDQEIALARGFDRDNHWWEVPPEQMQRLHSAIIFLDAKGYKYYIPAYMTQALKTYETDSLIMDMTLGTLFRVTTDTADQFSLLDNSQRKTIAKFLWFMATETDKRWVDGLATYNATKALETFWYPYLS